MLNFREWFVFCEAKKPAEIALQLLGGDDSLLAKLVEILPSGIKADEKNKYLLIASYFYKSQPDLRTLGNDLDVYHRLVGRNKMKLFTFDDSGNLNTQFRQYSNYLEWTAAMHGMEEEERSRSASRYRPSDEDISRLRPVFANSDNSIKVFKAENVADAIILGRGTTFCISQPGNKMFKSYRDSHAATFYFVFDSNRNDNLDIVVVDVGSYGKILLTDRINRTGSCQNPENSDLRDVDHTKYFIYLRSKGIDTSIFKNNPHNDLEKQENELLGNENLSYDWFIRLNPAQKSSYIGRGHKLSDEQFDFLVKHKLRDLLEQYVSTGLNMTGSQLNYILSDKDLGKKYMHFRLISVDANVHAYPINEEEFEFISKNMRDERKKVISKFADNITQMGVYGKIGEGFLMRTLLDNGDKELVDELWKRMSKKINATLGRKGYIVPLCVDEREILREKDFNLYKSVIIQNSHAGIDIAGNELSSLENSDIEKLHPHAKMVISLDKGDDDSFKKHFDSGGKYGRPKGMKDREFDFSGEDYYDKDYSNNENWQNARTNNINLLVKSLHMGKEEIADHILDHEIKQIESDKNDTDSRHSLMSGIHLSEMGESILSTNGLSHSLKIKYIEKLLDAGADYNMILSDVITHTSFARSEIKNFDLLEKLIEKMRDNFNRSGELGVNVLSDKVKNIVNELIKLKNVYNVLSKEKNLSEKEKENFLEKLPILSNMISDLKKDIVNLKIRVEKGRDVEDIAGKFNFGSRRKGKIDYYSGKSDRWARN